MGLVYPPYNAKVSYDFTVKLSHRFSQTGIDIMSADDLYNGTLKSAVLTFQDDYHLPKKDQDKLL